MTHDELLGKIDEAKEWINSTPLSLEFQTRLLNQHKALRAAVELHKPWTSKEDDNYFWGFRIEYGKQVCPICGLPSYPCPTIQAIQEQLK